MPPFYHTLRRQAPKPRPPSKLHRAQRRQTLTDGNNLANVKGSFQVCVLKGWICLCTTHISSKGRIPPYTPSDLQSDTRNFPLKKGKTRLHPKWAWALATCMFMLNHLEGSTWFVAFLLKESVRWGVLNAQILARQGTPCSDCMSYAANLAI